MENVASLIVNAEIMRMLILLAFGYCGYVQLKTSLERKIDHFEASLSHKIDRVEYSLSKRIDALDHNALYHKIGRVDTKERLYYKRR